MEQLIQFLKNLWTQTIAPSWKAMGDKQDNNTDKIVRAIQGKENPEQIALNNPQQISNPIVEAQDRTTEAVRSIPKVEIPETDFSSIEKKLDALKEAISKKKMDVKVGKTKVNVDTNSVVEAIDKLRGELPKLEKQEIIDYTLILDEIASILEKPKYSVDLMRIQDSLARLATTEDMSVLSQYLQALIDKPFPEHPAFTFDKYGQLRVKVDRVGGGGGADKIQVTDTSGNVIDSAEHGGVYALNVHQRPVQTYSVQLEIENLQTSQDYILVDLSDAVNFPHTKTGHIHLDSIYVNINPSTAFQGDVELGYLKNVDGTNGDLVEVVAWHMDQQVNNISESQSFFPNSFILMDNYHIGKIYADQANFNTGASLTSPIGTSPAGNGDLALRVERTAGNIDISITIGYHTELNA